MQRREKKRDSAAQQSPFRYFGALPAFAGLALASMPAAAQSGGQEVAAMLAGIFGLLLALGILIAAILYLASLYKTLAACAPANRSLAPGLVWLNLIPVFSSIWIFVTVISVASSLRREHAERGIVSDAGHGFGSGLAFAICGLLANLSGLFFSFGPLPAGLYAVFALATLVLWIIHWSSVVRSRHELERNARLPQAGTGPGRNSDVSPPESGSADPSGGGESGGTPAPKSGPSTGTIVGIVFGVLGLAVIVGGGLLIVSLASNSGNRLKAVSLDTDGLFVPDVVAVLHNTGRGSYFSFLSRRAAREYATVGKRSLRRMSGARSAFHAPR